ncbi:uncharacterized protein FTJAE_13874 [Fusarium tjaetaba]|uniref:Peptidase M3A/M3B catalytic domain-containing protein n=1 Tax=Fusarium tjaetaba TaxID=1567544 RepID=A0A8H5QFI3_9HYPO|nr:uncharacterized protein FTJAE_13874 [Fusarium tjaetaba]KAF5613663.1 hypothetical protein FTJAE_13874 [Fusarium tjaetaba]
MPITEATRQSVGYVVLALHGLVILIGFLIDHTWKLYKTILRGTPVDQNSSSHSTSGGSDSINSFQMDPLETHSTADLLEYRQAPSREPSRRDFQPDPSTLFRPPRSGATSPAYQAPRPATASSIPRSPTTDNSGPSTGHFSIDLALSEVALQPGIDYSFRESDRFYGIDEERVFVSSTSTPDADTNTRLSPGLRRDETACGDKMDYKSLPQPLPRLIPADQILLTMKRIVGRYQATREDIIQSADEQAANFDNVIQPLIDIDNETQGDIAIIAMLRYASPDKVSRQASEEACTLINEDQAAFTARPDFWCFIKAVKGNQGTSPHFEARKYLDKVFLEFKQFGHGTLQPAQIQEEDTGGIWFSIDELAGVQQHDLDRFGKDPDKHDMRFVRFSTSDSLVIYRNASKSATRKKNLCYLGGSTWHEDVRAYSVWDDREASKGQFIGYLYMDLLSRDNKYKGSQNVNLQCIISLFHGKKPHTNKRNTPGLIRSELGHGIHDLLARTNYVAFNGHRSPPDFAEALSVMLEKWCWMKPELKRLGLHYTRTDLQLKEKWLREHPGEGLPPGRIPNDTIEKLIEGRQVTRSLWYLRQMVYAQFDMAVHHPKSHSELLKMDFTKVFIDLLEKLWLVRAPQPEDQGYPHADLGHLVSGYDAGYYSYLRRVDLDLAT